ncbi:unnamed protein product [Cuscuta europaea]|uniref:Uncharacterized protein n=1 Tax=Cuscuta europaea TaxID=41803 RepID=A0A9P0ZHX8_CUSEU|nr:unnamed protein product [Cuscuta europaea]
MAPLLPNCTCTPVHHCAVDSARQRPASTNQKTTLLASHRLPATVLSRLPKPVSPPNAQPDCWSATRPPACCTAAPTRHINPPIYVTIHQVQSEMDLFAKKISLSENKMFIRKAAELRRQADIQFDSSVIGVGEVCKAITCLEIAAFGMGVIFDRQAAIKLSGMTEKAYNRSFNSLQNGIGVKSKLDIRELTIQFGCIRLIPFVQKGLAVYKDRFVTSLPPSRRLSADFSRPVFTAVTFYLSA